MNAPVLSVVLPFYNAQAWLNQALTSLLRQTWRDFQVIAIDDGSHDASAQIVASASRAGLPITSLRNDRNLGIVASLNRGIDAANGRFVARMDADDICVPGRFQKQLQFLEATGTDLCGSWFVEFGQGLPRVVRWPHREPELKAAMLFQNTICHPTVMARREVFERYRYREEYRLAEDYDLFARASAEFRMANVPVPLLRYRRHRQQATQAKRDAMEQITRRIRLEALRAQRIEATSEEQELHNLIRAPQSIRQMGDLEGIEAWLLKLIDLHENKDARQVIASQWLRACIRAAPLGMRMFRAFRASPLLKFAQTGVGTTIDMATLAGLKLNYRSAPFNVLRRLGLSA